MAKVTHLKFIEQYDIEPIAVSSLTEVDQGIIVSPLMHSRNAVLECLTRNNIQFKYENGQEKLLQSVVMAAWNGE
jgi:hypothetical protein